MVMRSTRARRGWGGFGQASRKECGLGSRDGRDVNGGSRNVTRERIDGREGGAATRSRGGCVQSVTKVKRCKQKGGTGHEEEAQEKRSRDRKTRETWSRVKKDRSGGW